MIICGPMRPQRPAAATIGRRSGRSNRKAEHRAAEPSPSIAPMNPEVIAGAEGAGRTQIKIFQTLEPPPAVSIAPPRSYSRSERVLFSDDYPYGADAPSSLTITWSVIVFPKPSGQRNV